MTRSNLLVAAAVLVAVVARSAHTGVLPNGSYTITPAHSGKCIDVAWAATNDGANIAQVACNGNNAQAFDIVDTGAGWYKITNINSHKVMDVSGNSMADGANIQQWSDNKSGAQRFQLSRVNNNEFLMINKTSGKCLDVAGASIADGANIQQWSCHGGANQRFRFGSRDEDFNHPPPDLNNMVEIGVKNGCSFPITIHGAGAQGALQPDWALLNSGQMRWYYAPQTWTAARVTAYAAGSQREELEKAEMTFVTNPSGVVLNYNVTYVDWLGLPLKVNAVGGGPDCRPTTCEVAQQAVLTGCPDGLRQGNKCLAPRTYCADPAHRGTELCNRLNNEITRCASTKAGCGHVAGAQTPDVYACSGAFAKDPRWCAALNRGMIDNPDSTDSNQYYLKAPYNNYAKWVHTTCPGVYAFPYDDYPSRAGESGFHSCTQGKRMEITFCPRG